MPSPYAAFSTSVSAPPAPSPPSRRAPRRACSAPGGARRARRTAAELRGLLDLEQGEFDHDKKDPAQAAKLIAGGASKPANVEAVELAAWTTGASTILNLDETITKE